VVLSVRFLHFPQLNLWTTYEISFDLLRCSAVLCREKLKSKWVPVRPLQDNPLIMVAANSQDGAAIPWLTMPLALNTHLGRYDVRSKLGEGGMGEVYLAQDTKLGRLVALKILPADIASDHTRLQRFTQEAQAASALNHPNIITIYEIDVLDSVHFIATEFIDGETLRQRAERARLSIAESVDVATQVAAALSAAHTAGIVHRDIKPENIMLRRDQLVKLVDFGLAKVTGPPMAGTGLESPTKTMLTAESGTVMGTLPYLSPEQVRGIESDARCDIWGLGCVLYEIVTGHRPFSGATAADLLASIIKTTPAPLARYCPDAPATLQEIVGKALEKDRDERYQHMEDLLVDLRHLKKRLDFESELQRREMSEGTVPTRTEALSRTAGVEAPSPPPNNLSAQRASLVGRERETAQIVDMLRGQDTRLLTLTGVGGTGKTTLARAVARQLLGEFPDGVFFIELSAIQQASLIASTIAQPLEVKEAEGKPSIEALKEYLRDRNILLVLDNLEHLPAAGPILAELLAASQRMKMMVTSRALLHLNLEREYMVPPLAAPEALAQVSTAELGRNEAVRLFVERARVVNPTFVLTDENARSVAEICVRVDGLPLAIELAAARVRVLSPRAILSRLDHRLQLLTGGARDLPTRQQTISGAMDWSYELLSDGEKRLFRRLAVFAGGFTLEAAEGAVSRLRTTAVEENVAAEPLIEVLDGITSLVDKSLLGAKPQSRGEVRFRMLEVVREYALDRLEVSGEAQPMQRHHAAYFLAFAEETEPHLHGPQPADWLKRLEDEQDNIRAALRWSLAYDVEWAARLGAAIRSFWVFRGHLAEGLAVSQDILRHSDQMPLSVRWNLLSVAGNLAKFQGDYETARRMYEEGLSDGRSAHDLRQVSLSCRGLGGLAYEEGDYPAARGFVEEALAAARKSNDTFGVARSLSMLGDLARSLGDDTAARPLYEEALAICRQLDRTYSAANILTNLAAAEFGEGNYDAAYAHFTEGLTMQKESGGQIVGDKISISYSLDGLAALAAQRGETELAAKLAGAAEHLRESINYNVEPAERRFRDAYMASLHTVLSEQDFSSAYGRGRTLKLDEAVLLALGEIDR
jgi:predicted ATPase/serine/threonine protein kinase